MCDCAYHNPDSVISLPSNKWKVGQRVCRTWHRDGEPTFLRGVIIPYASNIKKDFGIYVQWENGSRTWEWDFMIENGIGYNSPISEYSEN